MGRAKQSWISRVLGYDAGKGWNLDFADPEQDAEFHRFASRAKMKTVIIIIYFITLYSILHVVASALNIFYTPPGRMWMVSALLGTGIAVNIVLRILLLIPAATNWLFEGSAGIFGSRFGCLMTFDVLLFFLCSGCVRIVQDNSATPFSLMLQIWTAPWLGPQLKPTAIYQVFEIIIFLTLFYFFIPSISVVTFAANMFGLIGALSSGLIGSFTAELSMRRRFLLQEDAISSRDLVAQWQTTQRRAMSTAMSGSGGTPRSTVGSPRTPQWISKLRAGFSGSNLAGVIEEEGELPTTMPLPGSSSSVSPPQQHREPQLPQDEVLVPAPIALSKIDRTPISLSKIDRTSRSTLAPPLTSRFGRGHRSLAITAAARKRAIEQDAWAKEIKKDTSARFPKHPITLTFISNDMEQHFRRNHAPQTRARIRIICVIVILLEIAFGLQDLFVSCDNLSACSMTTELEQLLIIRYAFIIPIFIAFFSFALLSSPERWARGSQPAMAVAFLLISAAHMWTIIFTVKSFFVRNLYVGSLQRVMMHAVTSLRIRFIYLITVGGLVVIVFPILMLLVAQASVGDALYQSVWLFGTIFLGSVAARELENTERSQHELRVVLNEVNQRGFGGNIKAYAELKEDAVKAWSGDD